MNACVDPILSKLNGNFKITIDTCKIGISDRHSRLVSFQTNSADVSDSVEMTEDPIQPPRRGNPSSPPRRTGRCSAIVTADRQPSDATTGILRTNLATGPRHVEVLPWRCPKVCFLQDKGGIHQRYGHQEEVPTVVCGDHTSPGCRHDPYRCDEVSHDPSPMCHIRDEHGRFYLG